MVTRRDELKFQKEFRESLEQELLSLEISGCSSHIQSQSKSDISSLVTCSQNIFEDLIKVYMPQEAKVSSIHENSTLSFSGTGVAYILVEDDCELVLDFTKKLPSHTLVKILVKEGVTCRILSLEDTPKQYLRIEVHHEKDAHSFIGNACFSIASSHILVYHQESSGSKLVSTSLLEQKAYLDHSVFLLGANSTSDLLVNCILEKDITAISDGCVHIGKQAKDSSGYLTLKSLLLSEHAQILTEPKLEIFHNQVACSHGASISQISPEDLFYLQSKGITKSQSVQLIVEGLLQVLDSIDNSNYLQDSLELFLENFYSLRDNENLNNTQLN